MRFLVAGASHIDTVAVAELLATRHQVENLTTIIDHNGLQNDEFSDYSRYEDKSRPERICGWVNEEDHTLNIMDVARQDSIRLLPH